MDSQRRKSFEKPQGSSPDWADESVAHCKGLVCMALYVLLELCGFSGNLVTCC